ncbi:MAG TPA: hypothetical protein VJB60_03445 [Candidatus Peribacterales bacterium]|nr:hypothetical protein [Candidatus Peribacterales bacterium]
MHFFDSNQWLSSEERLCRQLYWPSSSPAAGSDDYLRDEAERTRKSTDFTAQMIERANSLQMNVDTNLLTDHSLWREAWVVPATYTNPIPLPGAQKIEDPATLLNHVDPESRKQFLIQYLKERFPKAAVDTDSDFLFIKNSPPADLALPDQIKSISTFMAIGEEMNNVHEVGTANIAPTRFATPDVLMNWAKQELKSMYRQGYGFTARAFADFCATIDRDPTPRSVASSDPANLWLIIHGDRTPFAAALNPKYNTPTDPMFTKDELTQMTRNYQRKKLETGRVVLDSVESRRKVQNKIDVAEKRSFATKLLDNYSNLETWQKFAMLSAIAALTFWTFKKREKWGLVQYAVAPLLLGSAFYFTGARDMFKGTIIDDSLKPFEKGFRETFAWMRSDNNPDLTKTEDLDQYAVFVEEIATEEIKNQVEAMGYISTIPLKEIATSFTLKNGAREGTLNMDRSSPLSQEIQRLFGSTTQAHRIQSILKSNSADLGDAMAHVFYMIGGIEHKDDYREVEKARGAGRYDDIPDGTRARELYERLAQEGLHLAESKYGKMNWLEVVQTMVKYLPPNFAGGIPPLTPYTPPAGPGGAPPPIPPLGPGGAGGAPPPIPPAGGAAPFAGGAPPAPPGGGGVF